MIIQEANITSNYQIIWRSNIWNWLILQVDSDFLDIYNDMMKMNIYNTDPAKEKSRSNDKTIAVLSNKEDIDQRFTSL